MAENKGRLLVVEDEGDIAALLGLYLRSQGYLVSIATSVAEARELLQRETVDLVITDWHLSDGTGDETCEAARSLDAGIPVIVLSGMSEERTQALSRCNPKIYLAKPLRLEVLGSCIKTLLDERGATMRRHYEAPLSE